MKIRRLDLLAFGPFTGRSLDFGNGAGLYIVHGANEAGKSSSLRALRNLLYGIPQQTSDAFIHSYQNLRIGGVFEAADGTRLECIRRKARTNTLRGPNDVETCDESQLLQLLGGMDEKTYSQRFGIDYQELRRGGNAIVQGGGDLGEILFAAGAGMADVKQTQQRFEAEAEALFKPRGSNQRIGQSLSELEKVRKEVRDSQVPTAQWIEHDRELCKAEKRQREIDEELTRKRIERSRLDRIRQSLPLIGRRNPLREALAGVATARLLPESFAADRREATTTLSSATRDEARGRQEIERLEGELRSVSVPAAILGHRTAISKAHADLGSYLKASKDRPGLIADRDAALKSAEQLCRELRQPTTLEQAASLRLPKGQRRRIQELAGDCKALIEKESSSEQALRELDKKIRQADETIKQLPQQRNLSELDRMIRLVQKCGDLDGQLRVDLADLEHLNGQACVELARLTLYSGALEDLEKLPIPSVETIDQFERVLSETDGELRRRQEKIDEVTAARQNLQASLDALRRAGEVPTEAALEVIRRRRNAGWDLVLQVWQDNLKATDAAVMGFVEEFAHDGDLSTAFRTSVESADAIADRLRREADRVAQMAKLTSDLQQAEVQLQAAVDARKEAEGRREQARREWQAHWIATCIAPLTPREMRSWRNRQQGLVVIAADKRKREADLQRLVDQIDTFRRDLNRCLDTLGEPTVVDRKQLSNSLNYCQDAAEGIRQENQRRERLEHEREVLIGQRLDAEHAANEARERLDEWRTQWADTVTVLGLDGLATPTEANSVIETVDELLRLLDTSAKLDERIRGIDQDAEQFKQSVRSLLEQVAPDLLAMLTHSVEQSVADLVDRLGLAVKDQTNVEGWQNQLRSQKAMRDAAAADITRWRSTLDSLCSQAGCLSQDELPNAEERSAARRTIEAELHGIEERLCELASGTTLEEWSTVVEQFDTDRVQVDIVGLDENIRLAEEEKQRISESIGEHRNELARMDGSDKAAEAQIRAECLLASIRGDAEEYIRKRLASKVLTQAIERFRESNQGPVLSRASELFSTLTLGAFLGLRADSDDAGKTVLVGVRPTGQTVAVAGMSEGTCDQIYLALRIALLESSLSGRDPLPFIVDDILIMFDNQRLAAALKVLSQFSQTTQVILFTHHEHLVSIARDTLNNGSLSIVPI